MTNCNVDNIVRDVRVAIDQNAQQTDLANWGDVDTLALSEIIRSKIEDAAKLIESRAPVNLLEGTTCSSEATCSKLATTDTNYVITVELPNDYMRLLLFKAEDWVRPVSEAIDETSSLYTYQRMKVEAVRGNAESPVVAIVQNPSGGLRLEAYSTVSETNGITLLYVPQPIIAGGSINLPNKLYRAIVYATAYLTALDYGDQSKAALLLSVAKDLAHISEETSVPYTPQAQQTQE